MPKTASRPSEANKQDAETTRSGFLFVSVTGEHAQPDDRKTRKVIRTHVMRNYLEQASDNLSQTTLHTVPPVPPPMMG